MDRSPTKYNRTLTPKAMTNDEHNKNPERATNSPNFPPASYLTQEANNEPKATIQFNTKPCPSD